MLNQNKINDYFFLFKHVARIFKKKISRKRLFKRFTEWETRGILGPKTFYSFLKKRFKNKIKIEKISIEIINKYLVYKEIEQKIKLIGLEFIIKYNKQCN